MKKNQFDLADPYTVPGTNVLKNKLGITDLHELLRVEAEHSSIWIRILRIAPLDGNYDVDHLRTFHRFLFTGIYDWAGEFRIINIYKPEQVLGGKASIEYSDYKNIERDLRAELEAMSAVEWSHLTMDQKAEVFAGHMARLWKIHPFRDGNTRTTVLFCLQFAEARGIKLRSQPFLDGGKFLRAALVAASAYYKSPKIGDRSKPEYLIKFIRDAMIEPKVGVRERIARAQAQGSQLESKKSMGERER